MISAGGAYSRFVRPVVVCDSPGCGGKNRFHRPCSRAFAFNQTWVRALSFVRQRWRLGVEHLRQIKVRLRRVPC